MAIDATRVVVARNDGRLDPARLVELRMRCVRFIAEENVAGFAEPRVFYVATTPIVTGSESAPLLGYNRSYLLFLCRTEASDAVAAAMGLESSAVYSLCTRNGAFSLAAEAPDYPNRRLGSELGSLPPPERLVAIISQLCATLGGGPAPRRVLARELLASDDTLSHRIGEDLERIDI